MNLIKQILGLLTILASLLLVNGANPRGAVQAQAAAHSSRTDVGETTEARIARAMSAGPTDVARAAKKAAWKKWDLTLVNDSGNHWRLAPGRRGRRRSGRSSGQRPLVRAGRSR